MRTCSDCGLEKDISDFNKKRNSYQTYCKSCQHIRHKNWYEKNKKSVLVRTKRNNKARISVNLPLVKDYAESEGCCVCGETDYVVLDFHHLDPKKKEYTVSLLVLNAFPLRTIIAEINKCAILCSNCHRRYHAGKLKCKLKPCKFQPIIPE